MAWLCGQKRKQKEEEEEEKKKKKKETGGRGIAKASSGTLPEGEEEPAFLQRPNVNFPWPCSPKRNGTLVGPFMDTLPTGATPCHV